jgi:hypothetical protein
MLVIGIVFGLLAFGAGAADAATSCGQRVLRDWAAHGRVGTGYATSCYRDALANMPADLEAYSSAPGDIEQALHRKLASGHVTSPAKPTGHSVTRVVQVLLVLGAVLVVSVLALGTRRTV